MAKEGNKSSGEKHVVRGPCTDCGNADGVFTAVRRYTSTGKSRVVRLCTKCNIKI